MIEETSTTTGGSHAVAGESASPARKDRGSVVRTARAIVRLALAHRRLDHVPTLGQVKAMAWFDGREPCSYLLDRTVNFVPDPMEFGYERELGQHALSFTSRDPYGRVMELVTMRDGGGFDLLSGF
ncbi:MAG TPA: hypothetical protein VME22_14270 [Solirubrobacteraceae bacterium]|nr:hypothetical protein [Solirubrobacteraceae bacterium]